MRCSRCGEEMRIKNVQTGTDRYGNPIYHRYAVCHHCRIKRDLDRKKRTKTAKHKRRKRKRKIILSITLLLLISLGLTAGFFYKKLKSADSNDKGNTATNQQKNLIEVKDYNDLHLGMTLKEVVEQIGTDGNLLSRTTVDTAITERYQWITEEGSGTVLLTFQDEKLISISQTDIKDADSSEVSKDSIAKLKAGMTLNDVITTLGSNGIRISETILDGITTSIYDWMSSDDGSFYSIVFVDDKMQHITSPKPKADTSPVQDTDQPAKQDSTNQPEKK